MKEFEKQWQKIAEQMYDAPMYWCKAGWKAALEWFKSEMEKDTSYFQNSWEWVQMLEKELNE
jgi:hypothetical protein